MLLQVGGRLCHSIRSSVAAGGSPAAELIEIPSVLLFEFRLQASRA